ncbi:MAG TPA: VCBS repeat-containing protein, partial [Caldilinea sp.]|nr:VCBS repeat-containing protein [Caldilinea sp.]
EAPADATPAAEGEATAPAPEEAGPACPAEFASYPATLEELLAAPEGVDGVLAFLRSCEALDETNLRSGDWNGDGVDDYAVTIKNPLSDAAAPETDLFIFMSGDGSHTLAYRARPAGQISILAADDINEDGQPDLAWLDTTCGASTCFDTVMVRSWDGAQWNDWTSSTIVMAYADVTLDEERENGQGLEIILAGGEYGSVGAGPQRARTEVWGSVDGEPYTLMDKVYERSTCLYFKVLDAGEALTRYQEIGLVQAREMYNEAVTNRNLVPCGQRPGEADELRSFSLFRLALVDAYAGEPDAAAESVAQLQQAYPDSIYAALGQAWLDAYQAGGNIADACAAATAFAEQNPESYEALSDYGYANPTFTATDLCPVLAIQPAATPEPAATAEAPAATATEPITPILTLTATTDVSAVAPVLSGTDGELPACPTTLDGYASVLPAVIAVSEADPLVVETWLRLCDGMADDRGGMLLADFNGDGREDALFLPTIVSDLGFGPGGAQGAILIYHGNDSGGYDLVYSPDVYGQPTLLAVEDLNGDGAIDIAWTVEGCSTFCVKEVQIVTWDADAGDYVSIIEPGATIAEGTASVEALPEGSLGTGMQLLLTGGVSGTPEGGLEVDHTESWQSLDGQPFRRLSWLYNRETAGNDCLGLRLVEADVTLQAADVLGYAPAIEQYRAALDPALRACSIHGVPAIEELKLLQGLATFRLIQAQTLAGDDTAAAQDLAALQQGQPDSGFAQAAEAWLAAIQGGADPAAACLALQPIFDKETLTWQITDHFGINHPALAPEQVCFVPRDGE